MIYSFRDAWLEAFYLDGISHKKTPRQLERAIARRLDVLEFARTEANLSAPPGNRFEHLRGLLAGWCSIRVNKQYRLVFRWDAPLAMDVYLDPHTYR